MQKLVLLAAMVITMAGCGSSSVSSSVLAGTVNVAGKWVGIVSVSPENSSFANYTVSMKLAQSGVGVFGSYSSSGGTGGLVSGTVENYAVMFTPPTPLFVMPTGCTGSLASSPGIVTNNGAGKELISWTYTCNNSAFPNEIWMTTLIKQ
jgi:hypothetical protein